MTPYAEMKKEGFDGKVFNKLKKPTDIFSWRIKFPDDIQLNTIPEENFYITDRDNVLVDFEIHVERRTNSVLVSPMDSYDDNMFYFLHIKKFEFGRAFDHKKLPPIHVGFKVKPDNTMELIWLKGRFDPKTVMQKALPVMEKKATSLKQEYLGKMDMVYNTLLIWPVLLAGAISSFLPKNQPYSDTASLILAIAIVVLTIVQTIIYFIEKKGKKSQSVENYNIGIVNYNAGYYQNAETYFNKALMINPKNQKAEKALDVNRRYLMKELDDLQQGNIQLERKTFRSSCILLIIAMYCLAFNALFNVILDTNTTRSIEIYFYITFYLCSLFQLIFFLIQKQSPEKKSVDEYNKGATAFESKEWDKALENFNNAIRHSMLNRHAQNAKELIKLIQINAERRKKIEEEEALKVKLKEEIESNKAEA